MTYEPADYWLQRGETYRTKFVAETYRAQEDALREVLREIEFETVLEVGCGFGRIAALLAEVRPGVLYTGIDLSPTMLAAVENDGGTFLQTSLARLRTPHKFDLVIAVEVLMHVRPEDVEADIRRMLRLSKGELVTLDWTTPLPRKKIEGHNFRHDYQALLGDTVLPVTRWRKPRVVATTPIGLQSIHRISAS